MFNGMNNGWGMGFGGPIMIVFWILVVACTVALVKWLIDQWSTSNGSRDKSPLDILRERYARGEINREEYEQKKSDLIR